MAIAKDYAARLSVAFDHFNYASVGLVLDGVHYGNARPPTENTKDPPQLGEVTHIAPSLLPNESLVNIDLVPKL
jgi:hypothetical protein